MFADLIQGEVLCRRNLRIERTFTNVLDYADNPPRGWPSPLVVVDGLADGILAGKIFSRQRLVNERDSRLRSIVSFGKESPPYQIRFECSKIVRAYMTLVHFIVFAVIGPALNFDSVGVAIALHRKSTGEPG